MYFRLSCETRLGLIAAIGVVVFFGTFSSFAQESAEQPELLVYRADRLDIKKSSGQKQILRLGRNSVPVSGDFDGDGRIDESFLDPAEMVWVARMSSGGPSVVANFPESARSKPGARPAAVPADFDGDGRTDMAIWRSGAWEIGHSSNAGTLVYASFGTSGDVPVPADYDGDSKADFAVFRPSDNRWYVQESGSGSVTLWDFEAGANSFLVPADYTGDGKADPAVYRSGVWFVLDSSTGEQDKFEFGFDDAVPVPADYDRDGTVDFAVYRNGIWLIFDGSRLSSYRFGGENSSPLSLVPVRQSTAGR